MQFSSIFSQAVVALFIAQAAAAPLTSGESVQKRAIKCMAVGPMCDGSGSSSNTTVTKPAPSHRKHALTARQIRCMAMGPSCEGSPAKTKTQDSKTPRTKPKSKKPEIRCMAMTPSCRGDGPIEPAITARDTEEAAVTEEDSVEEVSAEEASTDEDADFE